MRLTPLPALRVELMMSERKHTFLAIEGEGREDPLDASLPLIRHNVRKIEDIEGDESESLRSDSIDDVRNVTAGAEVLNI